MDSKPDRDLLRGCGNYALLLLAFAIGVVYCLYRVIREIIDLAAG
jgi:hypothetical protein